MNTTPVPNNPALANGERQLARVGEQVEAMQALLVRVLQDLARAEARLERSDEGSMFEINERLVVAAMASQAEAEAAQEALRKLSESAAQDDLTHLPNRSALLERFAQAVANARRHGHRCAMLFIDLDDFKRINDTLGHVVGDHALQLVASRLSAAMREVDTVCRHGGDEFLVLLGELNQRADAQAVAAKLIAAIGQPAQIDGHAVALSASAGIAVFPEDGEDVQTLVARADAAMYACKRGARADAGPAAVPNAVVRRMADLREANERLVLSALDAHRLAEAAEQARLRQKALLDAVADELRDPRAPIRIATRMLGLPGGREPLLPRVQTLVDEQMRLVGHLVEAVGSRGAGLALEQVRLDLVEVIDAAIAAHSPLMELRAQELDWPRPEARVEVIGDAAALELAVGNLLDNASRHTPEGGRIGFALVRQPQTVVLTVTDEGTGIAPAMLPLVFEPFAQDARVLGTDGIGLGVGLTVARALLRAQGGDLVAHSAGLGRGSRFELTLPPPPAEQGSDG